MLILTGPPAAGKNTIGALLARGSERGALIDVDLVRAMLVQPHRAPWEGAEGRRQQALGVELTCRLAAGFADDGCMVIILDVLSSETAARYRHLLAPYHPRIALLLPEWAECRRRFVARPRADRRRIRAALPGTSRPHGLRPADRQHTAHAGGSRGAALPIASSVRASE